MYQKKFKGAEWDTIMFTPLWAFGMVAAADGEFQDEETSILATELAEASLYKDEFTREVLRSLADSMPKTMAAYAKDTRSALKGLADAADILDKRLAAGVSDDFKRTVLVICVQTAKAAGGVSSAEEAAVAMVALSLRIQIPGT